MKKHFFYSPWFVVSVCMIPVVFRILFGHSPSTHPEANCFIMHYNSGAMLHELIFDPVRTDWANYQARELSYLLDYIDAKFIFYSILNHFSHFYSVTSIFFLVMSGVLIYYKLKKLFPGKNHWLLLAVPFMYVCCYIDSIGFFRSSKPAVSFLLLLLFFEIAEMLKEPERFLSVRSQTSIFIVLLLLPFFDRIGFFITAVCAGSSALMLTVYSCNFSWIKEVKVEKYKKALSIFSLFALAAVVISLIYNFIFAPALVEAINHYRPSFAYQRLQLSGAAFEKGFFFVLKNYGAYFLPVDNDLAILSGLFITFFLCWASFSISCNAKEQYLVPVAFLGIFTVSVICCGMMIARHPVMSELPAGAYFQVFGAALTGIFAIIFFESPSMKIKQITVILIVAAILNPLLKTMNGGSENESELYFHKQTTQYTIELLNNPQSSIERPIPVTSGRLVDFVRIRQ